MTYKYNPFWQQRIRETVRHALNVHSRLTALRVDLRFPDVPAATDAAVISRFINALKARIDAQGRPPYHGTSGTGTGPGGYPGAGPSDSRWQPGFLLCRIWSALTRHNHITPVFTFIFCLQRYPTMKIITRGEAMRLHISIFSPETVSIRICLSVRRILGLSGFSSHTPIFPSGASPINRYRR